MHPITPTRGQRWFRRSSAVALAAFGVLAVILAAATPTLSASTMEAQIRVLAAAPAATTPIANTSLGPAPALKIIKTATYIWPNRSTVHRGEAVRLTGKVIHGRTGRIRSKVVRLQAWNGTAWRTMSTKWLSSNGYVTFSLRPRASVYLRLVFAGQNSSPATIYSGSVSRRLLVKVRSYSASTLGNRVVAAAAEQTGKWYRFGAAGPNAFDCSGLTQYVFRQFGVLLPHKANSQKAYGRAVSRAAARPGDLIIFLRSGYGYHVGIYAGGGYMYDAPHAGARVGKHKVWSNNVAFRRLA